MDNNKQNSVLLIIIAVATLLVAVVGATFAYFTASNPSGSTAEVKTQSGKMEITFADGKDTVNAEKQTGFEPSNTKLVDKTFTITGDNITSAKPVTVDKNGNKTEGSETSLVMPFVVTLNYKTTFINNELHVLIKQKGTSSAYIQNIVYGDNKDKKTLSKDTTAGIPNTLKSDVNYRDYYDFTVGNGTTAKESTSGNLELVYGEFLDTQGVANEDKTITFNMLMVFPDTEREQDYNKSASFSGSLKVSSTSNGKARTYA